MTDKAPKDVLEKIKKCLRLSKSNFENEAATALRIAQKLMAKYGLEMAEIDLDETGHLKPENITEETLDPRQLWPWEKVLIVVISNILPVATGFHSGYAGGRKAIAFIGTKADVAIAMEVHKILRQEILRLSRDEASELDKRSFRTGCTHILLDRSKMLKAETPKASEKTGKDLMVVKKNDIDAYVAGNYRPQMIKSRGSACNNDAYARGMAAGSDMNLNFKNQLK